MFNHTLRIVCCGLLLLIGFGCDSQEPADCPNGCSYTFRIQVGPSCTSLGPSHLPSGQTNYGHLDLVAQDGSVFGGIAVTGPTVNVSVQCGGKFSAADVVLVLADNTCPSGKRVYVGRVPTTPLDNNKCDQDLTVCAQPKPCL